MKNRRKLLFGLCLLGAVTTSLSSCNEDEEVKLSNLEVTVTAAETFSSVSTADLYVYLVNTSDNAKDSSLTDANGVATFTDLAPGTYNLSCVKALTKEQAGEASGYYEEITLNATKTDVTLLGGVDSNAELVLDGSPSSSLVIQEFYFAGATDYTVLNKDQYVKIYNNSTEVVYADGLYLASLVPQANGTSENDAVSTLDFEEYVYADKIAQVPGAGTEYPIQPGESITIALNAVDYTNGGENAATVDNSGADFELYAIDWLEEQGRSGSAYFDVDNADVTNMNMIYLQVENYGFFGFLATGASVAIFRSDVTPSEIIEDPDRSLNNPLRYMKVKVADIIDGADILANADAGAYKKLPSSVDAGFSYIEEGSYSSRYVSRKVAKTTADGIVIYKDTNNSSEDFEVVSITE